MGLGVSVGVGVGVGLGVSVGAGVSVGSGVGVGVGVKPPSLTSKSATPKPLAFMTRGVSTL